MRRRNKNKVVIFSLIGMLFLLVVGYAAFQTKLEIKGTSNISSEWRIEITNVSVANKNGLGESVDFSHTITTASMEANLYEKGDYVEYDVEVSNLGTLDAEIDNIANNIKSTNKAVKISFSGYTKGQVLKAKEKQVIKVKIEYDNSYSGIAPEGPAEVEIQPEYVQQSPGSTEPTPGKYLVTYDCTTNGGKDCSQNNEYLNEGEEINLNYKGINTKYEFIGWNTDPTAREGIDTLTMGTENVILYAIYESAPIIKNWAVDATTDFHSEAYKQSIISAEFLDTREVPSNAIKSWDVSAAKDGSVMAWVIPDETDSIKHHLYVGGKGGVIANEDSSYLFYNFTNITSIDFNNNFDTSNVITMERMFSHSEKLLNLDLIGFDTTKVSTIEDMFSYTGLTTLNLDNFDTSNVTNMRGVFWYCGALKKLNLCSFNTSKVTNMRALFGYTSNLEKVYVGLNWTTENVIETMDMWANSKISSVTQSNNCMVDAEDSAAINLSSSKTSNSITVIADASAESGIAKYEYSINGGNWIDGGTNNIHTFNNLNQNTEYQIKVRVTSKIGKQTESEILPVTTNTLSVPTFSQTKDTDVTINYPEGCGSSLTCTYEYNDKASVTVTSDSINVPIDQAGSITAKVTDETNSASANHTVLYNDLYVSSTGNDSTGYGTKTKPYATIGKAYTMATNTASIKVMNNITSNETTNLNQAKDITLTSFSEDNAVNTINKASSFVDGVNERDPDNYMIVLSNGNLTLENINLYGNDIEFTGGAVCNKSGTTLKLLSNTTISHFKSKDSNGPAVRADDSSSADNIAIVNIDGATLSYNESTQHDGGALYVANYNKLEMKNGNIINNKAKYGGGGISAGDNSTLKIMGGNINDNEALSSGGGIRTELNVTLKITGGNISSNNSSGYAGGGIYTNTNSNVTLENAIISDNIIEGRGGGLYINSGTFIMKSGTISGNEITGTGGGHDGAGICFSESTGEIYGGTIKNNISRWGGAGIYISQGKVTMYGGSINNNGSSSYAASAVGLYNNATFVLSGGVIKNNVASTGNSGGISVSTSTGCTYAYKSGVVCGNTPTNSYETSVTCPA